MSRVSSDVWYHFVKNDKRAECRYSTVSLSVSGSTANLKRHLKTKHPLIPLNREGQRSRSPSLDDPGEGSSHQSTASTGSQLSVEDESQQVRDVSTPLPSPRSAQASLSSSLPLDDGSSMDDNTMSPPPSPMTTPRSAQQPMSKFVDVVRPMSMSKKRSLDVQLLRMVCKEYHSFSLVEDEEFRKFVSMLNPGYKLPSRKTLSDSLLTSVYNDILDKVQVFVSGAQAVCVTCDGWTNVNNVSFYALTAHFLDNTTRLRSCLLECSEFPERHTSSNIAAWISEVLERFSIRNKVCAVVTDNAANIKAAVIELGLRHVSCFAHTLNLVVQSSITGSINGVVIRAKALVQYFKKSSSALAKLKAMQISLNKEQLKLKQDVPTRWNSTFDMLERLLKNKEPLVSTLALLGITDVGNFTQEEWDIMIHAVKLLSVFNDVTKEISAEKNVTLSKTTVLCRIMARTVKTHEEKYPEVPESVKKLRHLLI